MEGHRYLYTKKRFGIVFRIRLSETTQLFVKNIGRCKIYENA
jgi:hypothetical protein